MTALQKGGYRGQYRVGESTVQFDILPQAGFNVCRWQSFNNGRKEPVGTGQLEWKRDNGCWYIQRSTRQIDFRLSGDGKITRHELVYDTFQVNPDIDPKSFTLESVKIPVGSRFLDHRKGTPRGNTRLYYTGNDFSRTPPISKP